MTNITGKPEAEAVAEIVKEFYKPEKIDLALADVAAGVIAVPEGMTLLPIERFLAPLRVTPRRRHGTATAEDLESFCELVSRFKIPNETAVFASPGDVSAGRAPKLVAVINYHPAESPVEQEARFGDHRVAYDFPVSEEWQAWNAKDAEEMGQGDFAAWIEDRVVDLGVVDLTDPAQAGLADLAKLVSGRYATPAQLLELSRGLVIREGANVKNVVNLQSGEASIHFETTHSDADGKPLSVPSLFVIQIPVFDGGAFYRIPVRLRYRLRAGVLVWWFQLYRPEKAFDNAFAEASSKVGEATGVPVYIGKPDAPTSPPAV